MKLGKKIFVGFAMLFLSHAAFAAILVGPDCVTPTNVKIVVGYNGQPVTSATVPNDSWSRYINRWDFEGYAFNCSKSNLVNQTQWVTFWMKGTNYFNTGSSSDHNGLMARGGNFSAFTYQGIGPIFSKADKYGATGEYFTSDASGNPPGGCQVAAGKLTFSKAACASGNPNNVSLVDNKLYYVEVHATGKGMAYWIKDNPTSEFPIAQGYIDTSDDTKNHPNLFNQGGVGFFATWAINPQAGSSVEYSQINTGWFFPTN